MIHWIRFLPAVLRAQQSQLLEPDVVVGIPTPRIINEAIAELLMGALQEILKCQTLCLSAFLIAASSATELSPQMRGDLWVEVAMLSAGRSDLGVGVPIARTVIGVSTVVNGQQPLFNDRPRERRSSSLRPASAAGAPLALGMRGRPLEEGTVLPADDLDLRLGAQVFDVVVAVAIAVGAAEPLEDAIAVELPAHRASP